MLRPTIKFFARRLWGRLPPCWQHWFSGVFALCFFAPRLSRLIIPLYCRMHRYGRDYLDRFVPASGAASYVSFQDFFARRLRRPLEEREEPHWPCEGYLCESGRVGELDGSYVKKQFRRIATIFGRQAEEIPDDAHYSNVFLHNKHYHRIHAPVGGRIVSVEHIPGNLHFLRPWAYDDHPSLPALLNERVNLVLEALGGEKWFISIVGGPVVGKIALSPGLGAGSRVRSGEELGVMLMGSTCCIVSPRRPEAPIGLEVSAGQPFGG